MELAPTSLPIEASIADLRQALSQSGHAVLTAEPGAGKTTIVPLRLLDESWLGGRKIVLLEPRRVAARAAARRMARLLGEEPGQTVGWVTRDDRRVSAETRVEVVTEGVLTARLVNDPALSDTGLVIFDEFHERSLPGDTGFALALHARIHWGLNARLLVMSATIDSPTIAAALGDAPVIDSPGRSFPVEVVWRPRKRRDPLVPAVVRAVKEALKGSGDVLVFLPGVGEIRRAESALRAELGIDGPEILPLHGSLPGAEQDAALVPRASRRVVLATDLAETSLTVEGISAVVDAGLARVPRHDPRSAMTTLLTVSTSKASADQRAGRAGRTGPGIAIRLWSKVEHASRPAHLPPAITQVEIASLVLDLARRGITRPDDLPFLDAPSQIAWDDATGLLKRLGALDGEGTPTELGTRMASVNAHPRLARSVVSGPDRWLACILAALLDDRDILRGAPRDLPTDLAIRVRLIDDHDAHDDRADGRAIRQVRDRAHQLARRHKIDPGPIDVDNIGAVLARGFADRIARAKPGIGGRFVTAAGRTLKLDRDDPLAEAVGLVAVDLGGRPKEPLIWRAARLEARLDHLVYATPDLEATITEIEQEWGIRPTPGGSHPGFGTRNALLGLGLGAYLEIIGPDPDQPPPSQPRPFGVDDVSEPRLVTWAARVPDIGLWTDWCQQRHVNVGEVHRMSRSLPNGELLQWQLAAAPTVGDGVVPFLIEWPGPTPAATAASGIELLEFAICHNNPAIANQIAEYALAQEVRNGPPSLAATLFTPAGIVTIG